MPVEGRGLSSRPTQDAMRDLEIGRPSNSEKCSETADAYAQCRSNKGAPGIDGQDFADIEAYGIERWLAELAHALRRARAWPNRKAPSRTRRRASTAGAPAVRRRRGPTARHRRPRRR